MAWAGLVAAKSSRRVMTSRTGVRRRSAAPATSGSMTPRSTERTTEWRPRSLAPWTGQAEDRGQLVAGLRRSPGAGVTARVPSGSSQAVAACGSRYALVRRADAEATLDDDVANRRGPGDVTTSALVVAAEDVGQGLVRIWIGGGEGVDEWRKGLDVHLTRSTASSAAVSVSPMTSATGCPAKTATSRASGSYRRSSPWPVIGRSLAGQGRPRRPARRRPPWRRSRGCARARGGWGRGCACARPGTVRSPA